MALHKKHSYASPFHERPVAHTFANVGGSYPLGPPSSRARFVMTLFLSARTTRRLSSSRVMPDGQVPDSKWSTSLAGEVKDLLQPRPGQSTVFGW